MHDFSVNPSNTNDKPSKISDDEAQIIIERMELNRLRKKQGQEPILFVPPSSQQQQTEQVEEKEETITRTLSLQSHHLYLKSPIIQQQRQNNLDMHTINHRFKTRWPYSRQRSLAR